MPLRDIVQNMQGLAGITQQWQENQKRQSQYNDDKEANQYLQTYLKSEQEGNPDYNSLHQATMRSPELSKNALASLGIQQKQQGIDASNFLIKNYGIADNPEQFTANAQARIDYLNRNGRDSKDTQALLDQYQSGDITGAKNNMRLAAAALVNQGYVDKNVANDVFGFGIGSGGKAHTQFGAQIEYKDSKTGKLFHGTAASDPNTSAYRAVVVAADGSGAKPEGELIQVGGYGQTAAEKVRSGIAQAVGEKAGTQDVLLQTQPGIVSAEEAAKKGAENRSLFKTQAITTAENVPTLKRALQLQKLTSTGGAADRVRALKNYLGSSSTDEGELKSLFNQNILGQLKSTFGGSPTEGERAALNQAQASYDQTGSINIKLLENALKLADLRIRRGKMAAKTDKDQDTIDSIDAALAIDFSEPSGSAPATQNTPLKNSKGWALHTDAKGNKAYVSPDGSQYEEVQ